MSSHWAIAGVGRSGTTALYQLLQGVTKSRPEPFRCYYEPYLWGSPAWADDRDAFSLAFSRTGAIWPEGLAVHLTTPLFVDGAGDPRHDLFVQKLFPAGGNTLVKMIRANGRLRAFLELLPELKLVIVVRNPLDCVNSFLAHFSAFGDEFHPSDRPRLMAELRARAMMPDEEPETEAAATALWWRSMNERALGVAADFPDRTLVISYEAFRAARGPMFEALKAFLGAEDAPSYEALSTGPPAWAPTREAVLGQEDVRAMRADLDAYFAALSGRGPPAPGFDPAAEREAVLARYADAPSGAFRSSPPRDTSPLVLRAQLARTLENAEETLERAKAEAKADADAAAKASLAQARKAAERAGRLLANANQRLSVKKAELFPLKRELSRNVAARAEAEATLASLEAEWKTASAKAKSSAAAVAAARRAEAAAAAELAATTARLADATAELESARRRLGREAKVREAAEAALSEVRRRLRWAERASGFWRRLAGEAGAAMRSVVDRGYGRTALIAEPAERLAGSRAVAALAAVAPGVSEPLSLLKQAVRIVREAPDIACIVTSYNNGATIRAAVESALAQSIPPREIVIADDGSTDGSRDLLRSLAAEWSDVTLELRERNIGVAGNRHAAILASERAFFTTLDGDDLFGPGKLEAEWRALDGRADAIAFSDVAFVEDEQRCDIRDTAPFAALSPQGRVATLAGRAMTLPHDMLYGRALYLQAGGYDPAAEMYEDWDLKIRLGLTDAVWAHAPVIGRIYHRYGQGLSARPEIDHAFWMTYCLARNAPALRARLGEAAFADCLNAVLERRCPEDLRPAALSLVAGGAEEGAAPAGYPHAGAMPADLKPLLSLLWRARKTASVSAR